MSVTTRGIAYGYGVQSAKGTAVAATAGFRTRAEGGISDLKINMTPIDIPIIDGEWARQDYSEYEGIRRPGWPGAPLVLTAGQLQLGLVQVMDETGPNGGGNYTYTLKATNSNPESDKYLSLIRRNTFATSKDKRITDGVITQIRIASSEGTQPATMDVDFIGSEIEYTFDGSAGTYTLVSEVPLFHKDFTFKIGATPTACPEYDLTLNFNLKAIVDNNENPQEFVLGEFIANGTVQIPWADEDVLNDFKTSTSNTLTWLWGTSGSSGYIEITLPVKYDEPEESVDNDVRLRTSIPFKIRETSSQDFQIVLQP
jgi:hypothetical protein